MVGQNIGKYRVLDRVGRGGMGTVYRAIDETLHREVAIKVLNAELNDPEVAKRFRAEAITVARLSHPGIATIYELFQHDGQWLMVMEFVRGETLEQLIARAGALPVDQAAVLCMQSLSALAHAHSMGVVHRDLKPANIMRTDTGDVKIMDFGIARVSGSEHLTSVGFMMGTPAYMAPEQVMGHEIDARADLYAMGVVLFRLLTGQLPFKGDTPFAMAQAQVNAPPAPIESIREDVPPWVGSVLSRSLQKKPEDRFQSATIFHETLQQALSGGSGPSTYQSLAPTGLVATPSHAMPTGQIAETMLSTPAAMPSGRVGAQTVGTTGAGAGDDTPTPVAAPRPTPAVVQVATPARVEAAPSAPAAVVRDTPVVAAAPAPGRGGSRSLVFVAAAAVLVAGAGGAWWVMSSRSTSPTPDQAVPASTSLPPAADPVAVPIPEPLAPAAAPSLPPATPAAASSPRGGARATGAGRATTSATAPPAAVAARGEPPPPPALPVDTAPAVAIANVKVLLVEGRRASDRDVTLNLGDGHIVAVAQADGAPLASWPYGAVSGATYVHARSPRWNAALASPPGDLDVGGVFRASRHYLTLQNASEYVILRLEDINVIQVIRELEARTGLTIRRSPGNNQE